MITTHAWKGWYAEVGWKHDHRPMYGPCEHETPRGECGRERHEHDQAEAARPADEYDIGG